jgi:uncharacterized membrane protein
LPSTNLARRRPYIDVARGLAVLLMIEAHTLDAWTRVADRGSIAFRDATVLGGFAAPLFLWLAGLGVAMSASRAAERQGRGAAIGSACRRGLEIFALAFLFRLQALVLTPGGALITFFRVDILNIMGPAMAAAGLVWGVARSPSARAWWFGAAAAGVAMLTPILRASPAIDALPLWLQWYIRPTGDLTTFTLLPWAAFVFAGGAVGSLIASIHEASAERRLHAVLSVAGVALLALGAWTSTRPSIYASSSFWTTSPTWLVMRVGILTLALSAIYFVAPSIPVVERLGRASLFVYWIHVELVYGYASWLWRHRLPVWATAAAYVAFCVLMYGAIVLRDRVTSGWRSGGRHPSRFPPEPSAVQRGLVTQEEL